MEGRARQARRRRHPAMSATARASRASFQRLLPDRSPHRDRVCRPGCRCVFALQDREFSLSSPVPRNSSCAIETVYGRITLCGETPSSGDTRMATDHERVKALFLAAIERGDPADRRAFLHDEVGDDAELRDRLDALLAAYDQPPGALDRPLAAEPETTDATRSHSSPPPGGIADNGPTVDRSKDNGPNLIDTVIADRYKIRQEIGEGGMGTVYLAEQLRPVRRQVALEADQAGDGLAERPGPVRVGASGPGPDGPPPHRPRPRRRHDRRRPPLLRDGAGQRDPDHRVLRRPPPRHPRPAGVIPPGLLGRAARAPEGDHPSRLEALRTSWSRPTTTSRSPR